MSCRGDCHHTCEGAVLDEGRGNGGWSILTSCIVVGMLSGTETIILCLRHWLHRALWKSGNP